MKKWFILFTLFILSVYRVYEFCDKDLSKCELKYAQKRNEDLVREKKGWEATSEKFKNTTAKKVRNVLPSPHSELLLGLVLGIDDLDKVPRFNDVLIQTGTIHVVVVSGYNISLVFNFLFKIFGSNYKLRSLIIAQIFAGIYAGIAGFTAPVARALIMASAFVWGKYYGRRLEGLAVLAFSVLVMIVIDAGFLFSLSFQLSFLATLGLILFSTSVEKTLSKVIKRDSVLKEDLIATLSAQVLVWPLISNKFGRVSIISPIVNALLLWTVPLSTVLGFLFIIGSYISTGVAKIFSLALTPFLDAFIKGVWLFDTKFSSVDLTINTHIMYIYFFTVVLLSIVSVRAIKGEKT